jgi:hypothetical protein
MPLLMLAKKYGGCIDSGGFVAAKRRKARLGAAGTESRAETTSRGG